MATATPSIASVLNSVNQDLFSIATVNDTNDTAGVPEYTSVGSTAVVVFDTVVTADGSDVAFDAGETNSQFTLDGATTKSYSLTASVNIIGKQSGQNLYGWINLADGNLIGASAPVGTPLTTIFTNDTTESAAVAVAVLNSSGEPFDVTCQITGASASVVEISGYTVA